MIGYVKVCGICWVCFIWYVRLSQYVKAGMNLLRNRRVLVQVSECYCVSSSIVQALPVFQSYQGFQECEFKYHKYIRYYKYDKYFKCLKIKLNRQFLETSPIGTLCVLVTLSMLLHA